MKKTKLFFTSLVPIAFFATGISFLTTSCGETDPTDYVGNYDGTDWKGYIEGSITVTITNDVVLVDAATSSYEAENLIVPKQIKFEDGSIDELDSIGVLFNATLTGSLTLSTPTIPDDSSSHPTINNITSLNLLEGVELIGKNSFCNCDKIAGTLSIPNSVITIGEYAFNNCSSITGDLVFPKNDSLTIHRSAFYSCDINCIYFPSQTFVDGGTVFSNCLSLTRIVFDGFSAVPSDWWSATIFTSASEIGTVYSQNSDVPSSTFLSFAKSKGLPNGWTTE